MTDICFYFQVHQPFRLKRFTIFDVGHSKDYFDEKKNREVMEKVAGKCYLPMNRLILDMIKDHKIKVAYSITGTAMEQFKRYSPEVLKSFKALAKTGHVEFLGETYFHSLSYLFDRNEFKDQVDMHHDLMMEEFGASPKVFRNTELIYYNDLAFHVQNMGYSAIVAEGADHVLGGRTPDHVYSPKGSDKIKLLLKNYRLSDDIAFRFGNKAWESYPLTTDKFVDWCAPRLGDSINLFMDYETFGEHQWEDTGIFDFMRHLPQALKTRDIGFKWPSEVAKSNPKGIIDVAHPMSWADIERDTSAWLGNEMQRSAIHALYDLKDKVFDTKDPELIKSWRMLTTSDHFYYMCTKWWSDGDVHKYFNPYDSPYEAFIAFMNVLDDLRIRVEVEQYEELR